MDMPAIIRAIADKVNGWPALSGAITGVHLSMADRDSVFPYLVVDVLPGGTLSTFATSNNIEDVMVRMNVYSKSENVSEAATIMGHLCECFDKADLSFAEGNYHSMGCRRLGTPGVIRESEDIWHLHVEYSMMVEKPKRQL